MMMMPACNESMYGAWQTSRQCIWPATTNIDDLPGECRQLPTRSNFPEVAYDYARLKHDEMFYVWKDEMQKRGMTGRYPICGGCSFKMKCRKMRDQPEYLHCPIIDKVFDYDSECQPPRPSPCELSMVNGGCPAPETAEMFHKLTAMRAMAMPGPHQMEMMKKKKLMMFFDLLMGGMPMGKMMKGKRKMMEMGGPPLPFMEMKRGGSGSKNPAVDFLDALVSMMSGYSKPMERLMQSMADRPPGSPRLEDLKQMFRSLKSLVSDGPITERPGRGGPFDPRVDGRSGPRRRQSISPARILLRGSESLFAPKMNCVRNVGAGFSNCLCCCNWHLPVPDGTGGGRCVDMKRDLENFIDNFIQEHRAHMPFMFPGGHGDSSSEEDEIPFQSDDPDE